MLGVLKERLSKLDCVSRGWVLHGYPKTSEQADALESAGFSPNRVFFMDLPNDSIMERTTLRHLDPVTGERFHMLFNPPPTQEVRDRLTQKPSDTEENIRLKIKDYYGNIKPLNDYFDKTGLHINADQDPNTVFESLEAGIVNSVPRTFPA